MIIPDVPDEKVRAVLLALIKRLEKAVDYATSDMPETAAYEMEKALRAAYDDLGMSADR